MQISTAEYGLNSIYDEIFSSVSRIKSQPGENVRNESFHALEPAEHKAAQEITGLTVSYLSPGAAFTLQKIVSQPDFTNLKKNNTQKQLVEEDETEKTLTKDTQQIEKQNFLDEIQAYLPQYSARQISLIYENAGTFSANDNWLSGWNMAQNTKYANETYNFVFNINNEPKITIDLMHPNNRSFDFRI